MTWLDAIVLIVLLLAIVNGVRRGFLLGALDLITILLALTAGSLFYSQVAGRFLMPLGLSRPIASLVGFAAVSLLVQFAAWAIAVMPLRPFIDSARRLPVSREVDAALGSLPGLVKGVILAATLLLATSLISLGPTFDNTLARSPVAGRLLRDATHATASAQQRVGLNLTDFTSITTTEAEGSRSLPHAYPTGLTVSESDEAEMLKLLNEARRQNGLPALTPDARLQAVARAHSREMLEMGYFSHTSPVSGTPADRLAAAHISFRSAGENLAYAPSVQIAHQGLMNSPGHRANILSPDFHRVGIGVLVAPDGERMFTQEFTD